MENKSCWYNPEFDKNFSGIRNNPSRYPMSGKVLAFVSHQFGVQIEAVAIVQNDKTGLICVVPVVNVIFVIPGNM